jgi:hypothetical protein
MIEQEKKLKYINVITLIILKLHLLLNKKIPKEKIKVKIYLKEHQKRNLSKKIADFTRKLPN